MHRSRLVPALILGAALSALVAPAAQAAQARQTPLPARVQHDILAASHGALHSLCGDALALGRFARTTAGGHRVIVAGVTCSGATAAAPYEISAYRFAGGHAVRQAFLTTGRTSMIRGGKVALIADTFRVSGTQVVVGYGGYRAADAMCCPSYLYERTDTLTRAGATLGSLRLVG